MRHESAQRRRHRHAVGRRGQGQDRRLAHRPRAGRGALPGRPQRRPHAGDRRQEDRAAPDPVGHPARQRRLLHRQRRGGLAAGAGRGDGRARSGRRARRRRTALHQRSLPADSSLPLGARPRARGGEGRKEDRHHRARHRPGLRGQGGAARDPPAGPVRRAALRRQAARAARFPQLRAEKLLPLRNRSTTRRRWTRPSRSRRASRR